jgi:ketosteroid isomerase-like protein
MTSTCGKRPIFGANRRSSIQNGRLQQTYVEARKRATAAVVAAREAYRKAGGKG